jgi:hypothetical protein
MKNYFFILLFLSITSNIHAQNKRGTTVIPMAGNTFFSNYAEKGIELSEAGIEHWTDPSVSATIYK